MAALASPLPANILQYEILIRFPVKSVVRLRTVCKLWNFLISDPNFIQNHFNRYGYVSPKEEDDDYIILCKRVHRGPYTLSIISNYNFLESPITKPPYTSLVENNIYMIGSINGLVCIADYKNYEFIVWNPAIHWFKKIIIPADKREELLYMSGFCWDSSANDYKLVIKYSPFDTTYVYSCEMDGWSEQKVIDFCVTDYKQLPCVIVRGVPYWKRINNSFNRVLKFDVTNNQFSILHVFHVRAGYSLINLNDRLAIVEYGYTGGARVCCFDEKKNVWSKIYTIDAAMVKPESMCFKYGGGFVFNGIDNVYDPKSKEIKSLRRNDHHEEILSRFYGFSYTPSMLALQGMKPLETSMSSQMLDEV